MTTTTVVAEDRVLNFGKHKNEYLSKVPESYLRWLVSHKKVLAVRNRHYAVLAEKMLVARQQVATTVVAKGNTNWHEWQQSLRVVAKPVSNDLGLVGNLNGSRAFSLMR
jgi:hypothetical protein